MVLVDTYARLLGRRALLIHLTVPVSHNKTETLNIGLDNTEKKGILSLGVEGSCQLSKHRDCEY